VRQILVYDRKAQYRYLAKFAQNCDRETAVLFRDNDSALPIIDLLDRQGYPIPLPAGGTVHFLPAALSATLRISSALRPTRLTANFF
jgi:hypothetical protein